MIRLRRKGNNMSESDTVEHIDLLGRGCSNCKHEFLLVIEKPCDECFFNDKWKPASEGMEGGTDAHNEA